MGESRTQLGWRIRVDTILAKSTSALAAHLALMTVRAFGFLF
jgi:hypothetical protein